MIIKRLERAFALSEKGARDILNGFASCTVHNLTLFMPVSILYCLASDLLYGTLSGHGLWYALACVISIFLIMLSSYDERKERVLGGAAAKCVFGIFAALFGWNTLQCF